MLCPRQTYLTNNRTHRHLSPPHVVARSSASVRIMRDMGETGRHGCVLRAFWKHEQNRTFVYTKRKTANLAEGETSCRNQTSQTLSEMLCLICCWKAMSLSVMEEVLEEVLSGRRKIQDVPRTLSPGALMLLKSPLPPHPFPEATMKLFRDRYCKEPKQPISLRARLLPCKCPASMSSFQTSGQDLCRGPGGG